MMADPRWPPPKNYIANPDVTAGCHGNHESYDVRHQEDEVEKFEPHRILIIRPKISAKSEKNNFGTKVLRERFFGHTGAHYLHDGRVG